jgi:FkbM family methyltransferase
MRKYPSSDAQVLHQIWTEKEYETITERIKNSFSGKKLRIVDAGANVGYASVFMHSRLREQYDLEFIIIEPSAENLAVLEKNFKANDMRHVHIEKAGLYNKSCFLNLRSDFRDGKEWSLRVEESETETGLKAVEVLDILEKYRWENIDFVKIDIEGAERHLFENERYAGVFLSKTKLISIEVHEEFITVDKIRQTLSDNNFDCYSHGEITIGHNRS